LQRRRLENRQLQNQFQTTVETLMLEVKVAVREVTTAYTEARAKYQSMQAAEQRLNFIESRWKHLPGEDRSVNLYLEDLLSAQERLALTEFGFLQAQTTYSLSLMNLKRAMGTLLQDEQVDLGRACDCNLPRNILDKPATSVSLPAVEPSSEPIPHDELLPHSEPLPASESVRASELFPTGELRQPMSPHELLQTAATSPAPAPTLRREQEMTRSRPVLQMAMPGKLQR
jgi:hypothetical protein